VRDCFGTFAAQAAGDHFVLFSETLRVGDRTVLNARLHVPAPATAEAQTAYVFRIIDNDTGIEVRVDARCWRCQWDVAQADLANAVCADAAGDAPLKPHR
jgi:hypothetical protein